MLKFHRTFLVSIVAMWAVGAAYADIASTSYVDATVQPVDTKITNHMADTTVHVTAGEKSTWSGKQDALGFVPENSGNKVTSMSAQSTDAQYPSAKAVYDAIAAAESSASYDDTALAARVGANETAIETLNGGSTTNGSVANKIADAVAGLTGVVNGTGNVVTSVTESNGIVTATMGNAITSVTKSGTGNIVTDISTSNNAVTVTVSGTAIPQPSGECSDCVLHYNGSQYSWEEVGR